MNYVVRALPKVTLELAKADRSIQDLFQQICSDISMNPFPSPRSRCLTEDWDDVGSKIYAYSDDVFPYIIQYVFFEPTDEDDGVITVFELTRHRWAR